MLFLGQLVRASRPQARPRTPLVIMEKPSSSFTTGAIYNGLLGNDPALLPVSTIGFPSGPHKPGEIRPCPRTTTIGATYGMNWNGVSRATTTSRQPPKPSS